MEGIRTTLLRTVNDDRPATWRNILNEVRGGGYGRASAAVNDRQDDHLCRYGGS